MILLAHMIFGAGVGFLFKNPYLGVVAAFGSHYFLDMLPHVEYLESTESSVQKIKSDSFKKWLPDFTKVSIDFFLAILIIFLCSGNQFIVYVYAMAAIIPDGITVIHTLFPSIIFKQHQQFHGSIQHFTRNKKFSLFWRISTQVLAILVGIILLISR